MLKQMVDAGDIPPLEERLPGKPYVVPHKWLTSGKYGGNLLMITPATDEPSNKEFMYGHSLLRYLNDGLEIGPGLVESWESNEDASEWTLHFREGLKWSDGEPWTTGDIMFWWEDMVLNEEHPEVPPDEAKSGTGKVMEMSAPDDTTIVMSFDAPAPLTADRLAMWVNRGNGPGWMEPRHYMEQFHPRYGEDVPKNWATEDGEFDLKRDWTRNPECPTMTGWRLRSYKEGRNMVFERNPFYWCVDQEGAQLPYIDTLTFNAVQDPEVGKLQAQEGKINYIHGPFNRFTLADVSGLKQTQDRSNTEVILWDSGSGTGSIFFFNYDYPDENMRNLIREPKFRQALSYAYNRDEIQKAVYYNTGEKTAGTLSPKAIEYQVNDQGKQVYQNWRDSYVQYDPEKAKSMLDELGVTDQDGDGNRELPDGSKLVIRLDFQADAGEDTREKNNLLERDLGEVGIRAQQNPVPPEGWADQWETGRLMAHTNWEVGDGPNHLVYPQWLVPLEPTRWAPLQGQFYNVRGTPEEDTEKSVDPYKRTPPRMEPEEGGPIQQLWKIYDQSKTEPDEMKRHQLVWDMIKVHIENGPFFMGCVANTPQVIVANRDLRNIPKKENLALGGMVNPWIHPTPAVYDPETYYWNNPEEHS
jgi:peptide/nickel transport system substrate-binding protein